LFIALAGAYAKDADSIFGHTFLVFAPTVVDDGNRPPPVESALMPSFLLWTAVNFAADTKGIKWYELYPKGISGGLKAHYFTLPLYEKIEDYKGNQARDIRFFPIKISEAEYSRFLENLARVKDEPVPYKFFTYNCADGTYQILYDSLDDLPEARKAMMSPLDVIEMLSAEGRLGEPVILPSLMQRLQDASDLDHAELEYMEWESKQADVYHDELREQKMAQLRYTISQKKVDRPEVFVKDGGWHTPHRYSRFEVGGVYTAEEYAVNIGFRPLQHDQTDNGYFFSETSTLEILSTSVNVTSKNVSLHNVDYLHTRSTPVYDKWFRSWSYDLYTGYVEDSHRFSFGLGQTRYLHKDSKFALEFMLVDSFQEDKNHLGFQVQIRPHTVSAFRYGVLYDHLYQGFTTQKKLSLSLWMAFDLSKEFGLYMENGYRNKENGELKMSVRWYF